MHIVFFTMGLNRGGSERVIVNLCNECLVKRHKVTIITCLSDQACYILDSKINHIKIDQKEAQRNQSKAQRFLRRRKKLKRIVKSIYPDVIICFLPEPSFIALSLKRSFDIPLIISERADPALEYRALIYKIMIKILYPKGDGFVFQTEGAKNYFDRNTQMKSVIIPNSLSSEVNRPRNVGKRKKEIVAVGRLVPEKNYSMLLYAIKEVIEEFPEYVLRIYGEGPLQTELETLIRELNLENQVFLMGIKDNVFDLIYDSTVFVLSSKHEGMPNSLMEAMALGLPVVATDCPSGGPRSLIEDGVNGILVENNNAKAMIDGIKWILSDSRLAEKLGENAKKDVKLLEPEKINQQWVEYICKINVAYLKANELHCE